MRIFTLKTNTPNRCERIHWNREEIAAVITAAGYGRRNYPIKAALLKAKIDKFNRVTLYDLDNKVLRPMGKNYRKNDFSDDLELEDSDVEPPIPRRKNPKSVAAGRLTWLKRMKKKLLLLEKIELSKQLSEASTTPSAKLRHTLSILRKDRESTCQSLSDGDQHVVTLVPTQEIEALRAKVARYEQETDMTRSGQMRTRQSEDEPETLSQRKKIKTENAVDIERGPHPLPVAVSLPKQKSFRFVSDTSRSTDSVESLCLKTANGNGGKLLRKSPQNSSLSDGTHRQLTLNFPMAATPSINTMAANGLLRSSQQVRGPSLPQMCSYVYGHRMMAPTTSMRNANGFGDVNNVPQHSRPWIPPLVGSWVESCAATSCSKATQNNGARLFVCGWCFTVKYCSKVCQLAHYQLHRAQCNKRH